MKNAVILKISKSNHFAVIIDKYNFNMFLRHSGNFGSAYDSLKFEDLRVLKKLHDSLDKIKEDEDYAHLKFAIKEVLDVILKILNDEGLDIM